VVEFISATKIQGLAGGKPKERSAVSELLGRMPYTSGTENGFIHPK
jgi:hypothetical protein